MRKENFSIGPLKSELPALALWYDQRHRENGFETLSWDPESVPERPRVKLRKNESRIEVVQTALIPNDLTPGTGLMIPRELNTWSGRNSTSGSVITNQHPSSTSIINQQSSIINRQFFTSTINHQPRSQCHVSWSYSCPSQSKCPEAEQDLIRTRYLISYLLYFSII